MHDLPAAAGDVRGDGPAAMGVRRLFVQFPYSAAAFTSVALAIAFVLTHVRNVDFPSWLSEYLVATVLALAAADVIRRALPRDVQGECIAYGAILAVLFFGVTRGLAWPNSWVGSGLLVAAVLGSTFALRRRPNMSRRPDAIGRYAAMLLVVGALLGFVSLVIFVTDLGGWS